MGIQINGPYAEVVIYDHTGNEATRVTMSDLSIERGIVEVPDARGGMTRMQTSDITISGKQIVKVSHA